MTTTKRFTLTNPKNAFQEMKCGIDDRGNTLTFNEVVDLLNAINEENEQLKTIIQQLRTDNTKQKKKLNTTMKENEQLKCGNKNLKATLNDFINICNRLQANPTDKQTLSVARDMLQNMGVDLE